MRPQTIYFLDKPTLHGDPVDDAYAQRNFQLCRAVDINGLHVVLDRMIEAGLPEGQAGCFREMASNLLTLMRTENNRLRAEAHKAREPRP